MIHIPPNKTQPDFLEVDFFPVLLLLNPKPVIRDWDYLIQGFNVYLIYQPHDIF